MRLVLRALTTFSLVVLAATSIAPPSQAQFGPVNYDTLRVPSRSAWEDGYLARLSLDRVPVGIRVIGMGGTGLALEGGPEYQTLNPTSVLGIRNPELEAELGLLGGSATTIESPAVLDVGQGQFLTASNYRVNPRQNLDYGNVSFGLPITLLGKRGVLAGSYRRMERTGRQDETRVELQGPLTNGAEATFGIGDIPEQGLDAISVAAAREFTDWLDFGVNVNWMSGKFERGTDLGVSIFGFTFLSAAKSFSQEASGFNVDLGANLHLGRLRLAGVTYLGHDLKFEAGSSRVFPLPNPQLPNQALYIPGEPLSSTISVPAMFALGASYQVTDRLTLAADYWIRPWSDAEITRPRVEPLVFFNDPTDSLTYQFFLAQDTELVNDLLTDLFGVDFATAFPGATEETFSAQLGDTDSFRFGVEYFLSKKVDFELPIWAGFRSEDLTLNNVMIPTIYQDYAGLVSSYYTALRGGEGAENLGVYEQALKDVAEYNQYMFQGKPVSSTTFSLGGEVRIHNFSAGVTIERTSYDVDRFFLQDFDPLLNPIPSVVTEGHSQSGIVFSTRMQF